MSMLKAILNAGQGSSLAAHYGLAAVQKFKDAAGQYQAFTQTVPIQAPNQWPQLLRQLTRNKLSTLPAILMRPNLLGKQACAGVTSISMEGQYVAWPLQPKQVAWHQQQFAKFQHKQPAFYIYDYISTKNLLPQEEDAEPLAPFLLNKQGNSNALLRLLTQKPHFLNDMTKSQQEGRSQHQLFYSLYQQVQQVGAQVNVLVAHPRTLQNFCLFVAQQRGTYTPLKELFPHLTLYVPTVLDVTPYEISLQYCFNGQDVPMQMFCADGMIPAFQYDMNVPYHLELPTTGAFYEFISTQDILPDGKFTPNAKPMLVEHTKIGQSYAVLASFPNGLLRQNTNWLVQIQNKKPLQVRWQHTVLPANGFGEVLPQMLCNKAIQSVNDVMHNHGLFVRDYMLAFNHKERRHEWMIELSRPASQQTKSALVLLARRLHAELELAHNPYRTVLRNGQMQPPRIRFIGVGSFSQISPALLGTLQDGVRDISPESHVLKALEAITEGQWQEINPIELRG